MNRNGRLLFLLAFSLGASFASFGDSPVTGDAGKTFCDLRENDVVVSVNGSPLTWGDVLACLNFELQIKYFSEKGRLPDPADKNYTEFRAWRLRQKVLSSLVNSRLFELACKREGIRAAAERVEEQRRQFVGSFASRLGLPSTTTVERVSRALGVSGAYVERLLVQDANRDAYIWAHEPRSTNITAAVLQEAKIRVRDFNARADESNRVQCARLESIKADILAGADFVEMGKKHAEVRPTEAEFWDSFFWTSFKPDEHKLRDWAFSAKPGALFGPVENRDGISLYKLVSRTEGARENSVVAKVRAKVVLARITLHAYDKVPVTGDEAMKARMMTGFYRGAMQDTLKKFQQSMRIQYPNGTNLWAKLPKCLYAPPKRIGK